jgi:hypothetical protein
LCPIAESRKSLNAPFTHRFVAYLIRLGGGGIMLHGSDAWTCAGCGRAQGNRARTREIFRPAMQWGNSSLD